MQIKHKEWLEIWDKQKLLYGYEHSWYQTSYQRVRGCGPTVAAMIITYLNRKRSGALPFLNFSKLEIMVALELTWRYFTPNPFLGLYSSSLFKAGAKELFADFNLDWQVYRLPVKLLKNFRPDVSKVADFILAGLQKDCPVAFLNLHKGACRQLESWHWSLIVALGYNKENDSYQVLLYDNGVRKLFDLELWLKTSKLGGGFVYLENSDKRKGAAK